MAKEETNSTTKVIITRINTTTSHDTTTSMATSNMEDILNMVNNKGTTSQGIHMDKVLTKVATETIIIIMVDKFTSLKPKDKINSKIIKEVEI